MRTSSLKTTTAVLRATINERAKSNGSKPGFDQAEFAALLGYSLSMIKAVESGAMPLSEALAQRIVHETGVPMKWLLAGDLSALPMGRDGRPYSAKHFDAHQSRKQRADKLPPVRFAVDFVNFAGRLHDILTAANRAGGYAMPAYKVGRFLDGMERDGGAAASDWPAVRAAMLADIAEADAWFAKLAQMSAAGGQDVVTVPVAQAKPSSFVLPEDAPTKKGEPVKARPKSRKRKG
jgi:transcriptional regulator with XRE-family HTH domain